MSRVQRWVLLRGLARECGHWGSFPEVLRRALGPGHEVLAQDLPGCGELRTRASPADLPRIARACREALAARPGQGPLRLVALSLGAMVALEWARQAPQELAGCALVNTSLGGLSPPWRRLRPAQVPRLLGLLRPGLDPLRRERAVLGMTSADPARHPRAACDWAAIAAQRPVSAANVLRQLRAAATSRAPATPPAVPLLLLASAGDRLVDPSCSGDLARAWGLPLALHPWAGHDLPLDDPRWVAARLAAWAAHGRV